MPASVPHFSILMPTFNRAGFLGRALVSVLAQHETQWELLIADDGSGDGTPGVLASWRQRDPRIRTWRHDNRGQAASRNRLLHEARAPWIAFLDSDDELEPDHLARHREAIEADPAVDIWLSPMRVVGSSMVPCAENPGEDIHLDDCIGVGMLVLRRDGLKVCSSLRIDADNAYFEMIRSRWGESLREAFHALPSPDWIPG